MSVDQLISELRALPQTQRLEHLTLLFGDDDSWVPESFKKGMADFEAGRFVNTETALTQRMT